MYFGNSPLESVGMATLAEVEVNARVAPVLTTLMEFSAIVLSPKKKPRGFPQGFGTADLRGYCL